MRAGPSDKKSAPPRRDATDSCIEGDFRQALATIAAQLRARGVAFPIIAISFDEQREQLREEIDALLREKVIAKQREQLETWSAHARSLATEFSRTGDWRVFRVLLAHVVAIKKRLRGDAAA
jgi:hypothetical protein